MSGRHQVTRSAIAAAALIFLPSVEVGAQTKTPDKWITVVLPAEPPDLEGCDSSSAHQGRVVKQNVVETLIQKNPKDGSLMPRLATSWEQIEPTAWRIKLREGVTFHDGSPLNAETAKKALDRTLNTKIVCGERAKFFGDLTVEVEPVDTYTLLLKTSRPEPILPMRMAALTISGPNTPFSKISLAPVGTGPYVFESWQAGQQIILKRFDGYWGAKPEVEGTRFIWRKESAVRAAMVKIGEADIAHSIAAQDATDTQVDYSYLNSETTFLRFDVERPPLDDRRVRLALNYALDLNSVPGVILPKNVVRATQMVFPPVPGHNHDLDKRARSYDPAKARQLLAEAKAAGVPVDTQIILGAYPSSFPNAEELMEAFFTMFQSVGFNMKLVIFEPGQYQEVQNRPFKEDRQPILLQSSHDNNFGDPVFSVFFKYGCKGSSSAYCNPDFDKEVLRVSSLGGQDRIAAWQEVFRTLYEDLVPDAMLFHMVGFTRVGPRINFVPDVTTNNEIRIQEIRFK